MIVDENEALKAYKQLPFQYQSFYLHPYYLLEDIKNKDGLKLCFFIFQENSNIFYHAFYMGRVISENMYDIQSPYGYGGPIIVGDESFKKKSTNMYKQWCRDNNILVEFIRFHPMLNNYENYYGTTIFNRKTVYIDLKEESILRSFSTRVRTAVKKAFKNNVKIIFSKEEKYMASFFKIYNDLMFQKSTSQEYFFDRTYYKELLKNEEVVLVSALNEEGTVIAASIFFMNNQIAEYHLSASTEVGKELCASNLIIYEFALYAQSKKCSFLYLGGGNSPDSANSLLFFKKGFSKKEKDYIIGYNIYFKEKYELMKKSADNNRILFYR